MRQRRIASLRVESTSADLERLAAKYGAKAVLLAMPSASGEELRRLNALVHDAGLETLVMPPVQRLVGEGSPGEITRYRNEDILNRRIVDIDPEAVRHLVAGSRVLFTGAGGTIGSELIRQLAEFEPASLIALARDDSLLHHVVHSLTDERRSLCLPVIADIRDADRLDEVWAHHRPQVVFHAAALKHVPALEGAPSEGWKTNVLGTGNVLEASERHKVDRVVNISTDKAADPENVLGYTKRIAERLTAASARRTGLPFVSVRFGNVIGSRGSAIETFELQILNGGPVTITHPDVTRYFMAVREGGQAHDAGRRDRAGLRGAGARHGHAGPGPPRRPPAHRALGSEHRDRLHGPAPGREDARGAARRRGGRRPAAAPDDRPRLGSGTRIGPRARRLCRSESLPAHTRRPHGRCIFHTEEPHWTSGRYSPGGHPWTYLEEDHINKLILAFATVAFIGFGGTAVSAQTPPTTIPGSGETPIECKEWDGISPIPEICEDFYIAVVVAPPTTATTTTTVPVTVPAGQLPRTGSGVSPILGIGALLFVGGGIVVVASRRRTSSAPA